MSGRRYGRGVKNSTEVMQKTARSFKLKGVIDRHRLFALWEEIVGKRLYNICRPERLVGDTLVVRVVDSVWGQELKMFTGEILANIAELTGSDKVQKLRMVTGPIEKRVTAEPPPPLETVEVETDDIDNQLRDSRLDRHPDLRDLLARIWTNTRRLAKRKREAKS
ncbi:MAG: DUF721 domain-containing protein [Alphaproteobacteria bacterium]